MYWIEGEYKRILKEEIVKKTMRRGIWVRVTDNGIENCGLLLERKRKWIKKRIWKIYGPWLVERRDGYGLRLEKLTWWKRLLSVLGDWNTRKEGKGMERNDRWEDEDEVKGLFHVGVKSSMNFTWLLFSKIKESMVKLWVKMTSLVRQLLSNKGMGKKF